MIHHAAPRTISTSRKTPWVAIVEVDQRAEDQEDEEAVSAATSAAAAEIRRRHRR